MPTHILIVLTEQFSKYANVFFLFTACIQQIPGVSPTNRYTTIVPLAMVLLATAFKEMKEDVQRHQADGEPRRQLGLHPGEHLLVRPHSGGD